MSDALQYLLEVRPEAMQAYFSFLKQAGRRLDPKTRAIISVITKVAAQTEPGLRQYLSRALREGVSASEILDALLLAFPALGLTKITWAINIILQMDLPEFQPTELVTEPGWHPIIAYDAICDGEIKAVQNSGRDLFVYKGKQEVRVYDSRCPHQNTHITALALEGSCLTCPKHGWVFDVVTGDCIANGKRPLKQFPTRIEDSHIMAYW